MVKLIIHDFISNTLDLLVVVSKPKIVRKHYCYTQSEQTGCPVELDEKIEVPEGVFHCFVHMTSDEVDRVIGH